MEGFYRFQLGQTPGTVVIAAAQDFEFAKSGYELFPITEKETL
jgi:hypothetical protein